MKVRKVYEFIWLMTGMVNRWTLCAETDSPLDTAFELQY